MGNTVIQCPPNTSSLYYNYKGTFSNMLLVLVDHNYCFTVMDVGGYGSRSDGAVFDHSNLKTALETNVLNIHGDCVLLHFPWKCTRDTVYQT
jgi:hypothetical protein